MLDGDQVCTFGVEIWVTAGPPTALQQTDSTLMFPAVVTLVGPTQHLAGRVCPATINAEMYAMAHRLSFTMRCNLSGLIGNKINVVQGLTASIYRVVSAAFL